MGNILHKIKKELQQHSSKQFQESSQRYFKEPVKVYGVRAPIIHEISKENFKLIQQNSKENIFKLCEALWQSEYAEEKIIASRFTYFIHKRYESEDFIVFKNWVENYVDNWAVCDSLCNHTIGTFLEMYPKYVSELKTWATSQNMWMRRASAVSLIVPAKKGLFLDAVFEIASILLIDKEDLVQKGYGWLLKSAANNHEKAVFNYVISKKSMMPRTALRYAIEKMPSNLKKEALKK